MTMPPYAEYRESSLGWLDRIPLGWGEARVGRLAQIYAGGTPDRDNLGFWEGGDIPWVNSGAVNQWEITEPSALITTAAFSGSSARWVRKGALVLALAGQGKTKGMAAQMGIAATCNQSMAAIDPSGRLSERFLLWWLNANYTNIRSMGGGDLRDGLNLVHVGNIPLPVPPLDEQRMIARYLDRETAIIDELIAKQERLLGALTERQESAWAANVHEIFELYPTMSVRRVIDSIVDGPFGSSLTSAHYSEDGTRVIRLGNIGVFEFKSQDEAFIPNEYALELAAHSAVSGDVVVAGLGDDRMPLGRAAVVPEDLGRAIVKADCYRVRPNKRVTSEYLAWILSSPRVREQFRDLSRGSTRQRLNTTVVREAVIAVPPLETQVQTVDAFKAERAKLSSLVSKAGEVAETLRERRSALISAAVTGKIDVRGL